ncbi:MAG: class D beta-lactamase [Lachnospiraceae bacterium]|nr:class D beta-lactamase [Lachnospiraceae bacterium]
MISGAIPHDPEIIDMDWSEYFNGLNGAAVLFDARSGQYWIYHEELALTRRSPCSTFKIISSLAALESGVLQPDCSTRTWSGEIFWNEAWNRDLDFGQAFRTSCVWYFRELIDEIGRERIQKELDKLQYGNCDISDWEGRLNTNNSNRALTGFWIESSLKISPKEQTEVMERIFGKNSVYSKETQEVLRQVMQVAKQTETDFSLYGKTGMGKEEGVMVDAWFTGFAKKAEGEIYFCVYLGKTDGRDGSSTAAKEIAMRIIADFNGQSESAAAKEQAARPLVY